MISVVMPTLGRKSLERAMESLTIQTESCKIIVKTGHGDTLRKIRDAVNEAKTELVAICDDDAVYPTNWLGELTSVFSARVGYAGGSCLPLIDEDSNRVQKTISVVTSSFFGTTNMSYRFKRGRKVELRGETDLIGNGLYRRKLLARILNTEYDKISPAAWETCVLTRIRQLGYLTMYVPEGSFYHAQRPSIRQFAKQIFRSGMGRAAYFRRFPRQAVRKWYIFLPSAFIVTLGLLWPFAPLFLGCYLAVNLAVSVRYHNKLAPLLFFVMHMSYGLGMIAGALKEKREWQ